MRRYFVFMIMQFLTVGGTMRNLKLYPVCVSDKDCEIVSKTFREDYRCFQYMCYPWRWPWKAAERPFRKCHGDKDCTKIATNGPGMMAKDVKYNIQKMNEAFEDGYCFLHPDRGNVPDGICLPKREIKRCLSHNECQQTQKCIAGYCGDPSYFSALSQLPCTSDSCRHLLLGQTCCVHLMPRKYPWHVTSPKWPNKCCSNIDGSMIVHPEDDLSQTDLADIDRLVSAMSLAGLAGVVCHQLRPRLRSRLSSCGDLAGQPTDPGLAWSPGRNDTIDMATGENRTAPSGSQSRQYKLEQGNQQRKDYPPSSPPISRRSPHGQRGCSPYNSCLQI